MSQRLDAHFISEYAREYLEQIDRPYEFSDLKEIEQGQQNLEKESFHSDKNLIIQDTDFLTIWVWYLYKYKVRPERVYNYLQRHLPDLYLLCYPDLGWANDPLRENPNDLLELFSIYETIITDLGVDYAVIKGSGEERVQACINRIQNLV